MAAYDEDFYKEQRDGSLLSARALVPLILSYVPARSVLDVGCGVGGWLRVFHENGVPEVRGVDGDYVKRELLRIAATDFTPHDLSTPLDLGRRFDLAISLEVAEHIHESRAAGFVENLTRHSDAILFSAAIPGQGGTQHVNEQWPEYWKRIFQKQGFVPVDCLRAKAWMMQDVDYCYAQNVMFYVRESVLDQYPALKAARGSGADCLPLVHPRLFEHRRDPRSLYFPVLLPALPTIVLNYIRMKARAMRTRLAGG